MRINARLDDSYEEEVLANNRKILEMIGGIAEGSEDGSVNYKKCVMDCLNGKYPDH